MSKFKQTILPSLTNIERVDHNGSRHYAYRGVAYPSITTVLGSIHNEWLASWKESVGPERASAISRKAASIGTALHSLCEAYLQNNERGVIKQLRAAMPEVQVRFRNFKPFLDDISEVFIQEAPLVSSILKVAGTVDCFAVYKGRPCVIDFKTSNRVKTKEDIEHYFAQASFYAYAIAEMYSVPLPDIVIAIAVNGLKEPLVFESKPKLHVKFLVDTIKTYYELEKNREKEEESKLLICN